MKKKDLTNKKFERLKVVSFYGMKKTHAYWNCVCDCGKKVICRGSHLRMRKIKSCGCFNSDRAKKWFKKYANSNRHKGQGNSNYKHGESNNSLYKVFHSIKNRCYQKKCASYCNYGGRGIICEWKSYLQFKKDMEKSFKAHVRKYGRRNTTIERIDNDKNYCKENCEWATFKVQAQNRRPRISGEGLPDGF